MSEWKYYAAKGTVVEINTGTNDLPTYTKIRCLTSVGMDAEADTQDATTYESGAWKESFLTSRGLSFKLEGNIASDMTTGVRDPGQVALKKAGLDTKEGQKKFRIKFAGDEDTYEFVAIVKYSEPSGGVSDFRKFSAELTMTGAPITTE